MAACSPLQSPVDALAPTDCPSGSSSGDEESTRLPRRRWSVNGGHMDASLSPLNTVSLVAPVEIPSNATWVAAVPTPSTPLSPAKLVRFNVNDMFRNNTSLDAIGGEVPGDGVQLVDKVLPDGGVPPDEEVPPEGDVLPEDDVPPEDNVSLEGEVPPEDDSAPEDKVSLEEAILLEDQIRVENERSTGHTEPLSAAAQAPPSDVSSEVGALLATLSKFSLPSVSDTVIAWANRSREENDGRTLSSVVDIIFEQANNNPARSELYAELCHTVMEHIDPDVHDERMIKDGDLIPGPRLFRTYLLNRCQDEFQRGLGGEGDSSTEAMQECIGLVKFIGELFNIRILTQNIVWNCLEALLTSFESGGEPDLYIECLDVFLTTIGRRLQSSQKARSHADVYFSHIEGLSRNAAVSHLHRHKLQALVGARQGWKSKHSAFPTIVGDDGIEGHALGDVNVLSRQKDKQAAFPNSYDTWESTTAAGIKAADMALASDEPPPAPSMSESEAMAHAEEYSSLFFSIRDVATAEKYFARLPPGFQHLLVDALVDRALFSETDTTLVATLFDRVASDNLCSAAAFEDGFAPTTKHLAGIAETFPDAFDSYVQMFKGAHLDMDTERCMRIVGTSGMDSELMPVLFGSATSTTSPAELLPSSSISPSLSESAVDALLDPSVGSDSNGVTDDDMPEPCTVQSDRRSSDDDDDDLYADYTEGPAVLTSHIEPAPSTIPQQQGGPQEAHEQQIPAQAPSGALDLGPVVEERVPEPPRTSPSSPALELPLVRLRMSQKEAHERIEESITLLFGGLHDIDRALSIFATVPPRHHSRLVDRLVSFAIESTRADAQLVAYFFYGAAAKGLCSAAAFEGGFALTAAALEDIAAESPDAAVLLFATMARGAGLHQNEDWRRRVFGRMEALGYGPELASLSSS